METFVGNSHEFEIDAELYRKPVKRLKEVGYKQIQTLNNSCFCYYFVDKSILNLKMQ